MTTSGTSTTSPAAPTEHQCVADQAAHDYRLAAQVKPEDLTVVGSDLRSAAVTAFAWPGARLLRTSGTDAVDRLLLEELVPSLVRGRVQRVVVGSGGYTDARFGTITGSRPNQDPASKSRFSRIPISDLSGWQTSQS